MDKNEHMDDELLGRWLAGELTGKELTDFEASDAFKTYQAIASYSEQLETPEFDSSAIYASIKEQTSGKKSGKVVRLSFYKKMAIAASILVLVGIGSMYWLMQGPAVEMTSVYTAQGETKSVVLPDNSTVELNIASTISYDANNWENAREIELTGEAFFNVTKGNRFAVSTEHGSIEVLGTSFNIRNRDNITEVICYTGKVKVTDLKGASVILVKDGSARIVGGEMDNDWTPGVSTNPEWKNGHSSFHNVALNTVIEELENQYGVQVDCSQDLSNRNYVGAFPHDNLAQALQLVFEPMQLNYTIDNDTLIVIH